MNRILSFSAYSLLCVFCAFALSACQSFEPAFQSLKKDHHHLSMKEKNYEAVDQLLEQARIFVTYETPLLVGTLSDINALETSSALGRMITEQVSSRFIQRGHSVAELKLRNSVNIQSGHYKAHQAGEYLISRDVGALAGEHKAAAAVTGTYAVAKDMIIVNLRIIDIAKGRAVASVDYDVPLDDDMRALLAGSEQGMSFFGEPLQY